MTGSGAAVLDESALERLTVEVSAPLRVGVTGRPGAGLDTVRRALRGSQRRCGGRIDRIAGLAVDGRGRPGRRCRHAGGGRGKHLAGLRRVGVPGRGWRHRRAVGRGLRDAVERRRGGRRQSDGLRSGRLTPARHARASQQRQEEKQLCAHSLRHSRRVSPAGSKYPAALDRGTEGGTKRGAGGSRPSQPPDGLESPPECRPCPNCRDRDAIPARSAILPARPPLPQRTAA